MNTWVKRKGENVFDFPGRSSISGLPGWFVRHVIGTLVFTLFECEDGKQTKIESSTDFESLFLKGRKRQAKKDAQTDWPTKNPEKWEEYKEKFPMEAKKATYINYELGIRKLPPINEESLIGEIITESERKGSHINQFVKRKVEKQKELL